MRNANGELILIERVPRVVIDELIAEVAASKQSIEAEERRHSGSQPKGEHRR